MSRPRILTTNISLDDGTCDIDLVLSVAEFFSLAAAEAKNIVKEVATSTANWREAATAMGARRSEIQRMESAFEHRDLKKALAL
jgi:serine/threonine-protein kinase HipA